MRENASAAYGSSVEVCCNSVDCSSRTPTLDPRGRSKAITAEVAEKRKGRRGNTCFVVSFATSLFSATSAVVLFLRSCFCLRQQNEPRVVVHIEVFLRRGHDRVGVDRLHEIVVRLQHPREIFIVLLAAQNARKPVAVLLQRDFTLTND